MPEYVTVKNDFRADRLRALPPYLFVEIDNKKREKIAARVDVIDLGVGDPDRPTPGFVIEAMEKAIHNSVHHRYPPSRGTAVFREAAARFMKRRFGFTANLDTNILTCIGTKDGIAHLPLAVVNPGEVVLTGSIAYPVYRSGATFAGAMIHEMPMTEENDWLPDVSEVPVEIARKAKLLWVNYPNNPTAAYAPLSFYEEAVAFCRQYEIILASDNAYSEVYFNENEKPRSMWEVDGASVDDFAGIEFHSLSKTFNMTGWRIGFAVGNKKIIDALAGVKGNCDSSQFGAIQEAGAVALDHHHHEEVVKMLEVYRERRDVFCDGMNKMGCDIIKPSASFFVWGKCTNSMESFSFCERCLEESGVVLVPGGGFSEDGKNYFRAAMTVEVPRLREAVDRLSKMSWD